LNTPLNININSEDFNTNDFMLAWSHFNKKPSKITIYETFIPEDFYSVITEDLIEEKSSVSDIFFKEGEETKNTRYFIKLTDDIFISYTSIEEGTDSNLITEVIFYYNSKSTEKVEELVQKIKQIIIKKEDEEYEEVKYNYVTLTQNGLSLETYTPLDIDLENIEFYYNTQTIKEGKKLIKKIKTLNKGISVVLGERGVGKTCFVDWITTTIDRKVIQIPASSIDITINNPEFIQNLKSWSESILILDDIEPYFNSMYRNSQLFINNLLQLVDGFLSDELSLHIILIFNDIESDKDLETSSNFIHKIKIDELPKEKAKELAEFLEIKGKIESDLKLSEVISKKLKKENTTKVGF
jgi:hypothetical protein